MKTAVLLICPACSKPLSDQPQHRIAYVGSGTDTWDPKEILLCQHCGLGFAIPPITQGQMDVLYGKGEYWRNKKVRLLSPKIDPGLYALADSRWKFVKDALMQEKGRGEISILDIGAGHGFFGMIAAEDKDIKLTRYCPIESDQWMRQSFEMTWVKKFSDIAMQAKDDIKNVEGEWDLIVMSHILEHLSDPRLMLDQVSLLMVSYLLMFLIRTIVLKKMFFLMLYFLMLKA